MYGSYPYGASPYGSPADGASGAVSSPITALLAGDLHVLFEHLMWFRPYNPLTGINTDLYVSGGWYKTGADETFPAGESAPHQLFNGVLIQPPNRETRILSNGEINTSASSYGACVIADPRRELTQWLSYTWKNTSARHFMGDPSWTLNQFAEVFHGVSIDIEPQGSDQMTVTLQDVVAKLQTAYQKNVYAGRGPCVRLDGVAGYLSGTVPCPANSMTMGIRVRARASITTNETIMGWRNGNLAGFRRLRTDVSNSVLFGVRNDAGTLFEITAPNVLSTYVWKDIWAVLDVSALRISLYDGQNPDTPIAQAVVSGTFATVLSTFAVGRVADASSNFLAADVDEVSVWNIALTSTQISQWTGQRAPSGTAGLVYQYSMTEDTGSTAFESGGIGPNLTLNSATWVDSLTGDSTLLGKCIPKGRGIARQVTPILLSSVDTIYQVAETFDHLDSLQDGGILVWTLKGVYPDPWAATPAAGEYMEIPTMGLIRLGSKPVRQLTCDVYLTSATDLPTCITGITITDGVLGSTEVNAGSVSNLPSVTTGFVSDLNTVTVDNVLLKYLADVKAWRAPDPMGALSFGIISPPENLTPDVEANGDDFALEGIKSVSTLPAARAVSIQYRPYYQTQQSANVNPTLTESQKQDLGQSVRTVTTPDDLTVLAADPTADLAPPRTTLLDLYAEAQTQANLEAVWRSKPRRTDYLPYPDPIPKFHVGQVLRITMPVLDYDNGKNVIVTATIADDGTGSHGCEVTGQLLMVGEDVMLTGDGTGVALTGDATGEGAI